MKRLGNKEGNAFVRREIEEAAIRLLKDRELSGISVSEIVAEAGVSRNSFYRNYSSKEDILRSRVSSMLTEWNSSWEKRGSDSNAAMYGSLFAHLKENKDFYLLLKERGLFDLFQDAYLELFGPKPEIDNMWAYTVSFIAYGTLGWIEEWISRGMQESADAMAEMLLKNGMK
ncbi:MAG: TetR/AcrR family transcriptional regulator [Eubacteriales bacterium]|nr:TetR/AcrR family transcriptional regulator [Eubacteriales bacterium]